MATGGHLLLSTDSIVDYITHMPRTSVESPSGVPNLTLYINWSQTLIRREVLFSLSSNSERLFPIDSACVSVDPLLCYRPVSCLLPALTQAW